MMPTYGYLLRQWSRCTQLKTWTAMLMFRRYLYLDIYTISIFSDVLPVVLLLTYTTQTKWLTPYCAATKRSLPQTNRAIAGVVGSHSGLNQYVCICLACITSLNVLNTDRRVHNQAEMTCPFVLLTANINEDSSLTLVNLVATRCIDCKHAGEWDYIKVRQLFIREN